MKYTREEFLKALGVSELYDSFFDGFEESMLRYEAQGAFYLAEGFVEELLSLYPFLDDKREFVIKEHRRVRENELLARYSFLLYKMLLQNKGGSSIRLKEVPKPLDVELCVDYEMAAYFALLAFVPDMIKYYEGLNLPREVIRDTLADCFEDTVKLRTLTHGRDGFDVGTCFSWNQRYTNCGIIRVGVLNFEFNARFTDNVRVFTDGEGEYCIMPVKSKIASGGFISGAIGHEDEEFFADITESERAYIGYPVDTEEALVLSKKRSLDKTRWRVALTSGDGVISVHIPTAAAITPANCEAAYRRAWSIIKECFPEYGVKAFYCSSWLLDPQHSRLLSKSSNIVSFGNRYMRYPLASQGRGVFSFLFRRPFNSLEELPENTSLERAVKKHYLDGNYVYEAAGVFFVD